MAQVYDIRTINGVAPPIPATLDIDYYTLDKESYTTASGLLVRNIVANKMKFFLTFPPMTKTELKVLLDLLNANSLTVTYEDFFSGTVKSGTFYHGDLRKSPDIIRNLANTDVLMKPFSVNLIEY